MPTITMNEDEFDQDPSAHSQFKSARREVARRSTPRTPSRPRRERERHLSVRSELRAEPDVRKIARAVIQMALAQAEADAKKAASGQPPADTLDPETGGPDD